MENQNDIDISAIMKRLADEEQEAEKMKLKNRD